MIRRLLVANRGEIALRIIKACTELGVESVAVHSTVDAGSPHVLAATRAIEIGPAPAAESYLSIPKILAAARESGADAVHPGYGFLSENPDLATAAAEAGLVFVGPPADAIRGMGSKITARRLMDAAGIPVVRGETPSDQSEERIMAAARRVGVPAVIKASAGGGGTGMRVVRTPDEVETAVHGARREAVAAFADGTLYVERLLEHPRHIEVQIFADHHGRVVHLFERECSIQRRHQKIVEESPSPAVTPTLRTRLGEAAVEAARAVGYRNAGTIEFLLEGEGDAARFYFLEMNTRLQVEHPVTEMVTGVDLVHAQLAVASGQPLPWSQADLDQRGHAIECRVYAEDPDGFLPQAGRIELYREPTGPGLRVDSGIREGSEVPLEYDALLAKLVAHAETRQAACARAAAGLRAYPVLGVRTNIAFLLRILEHPRFQAGAADTGFVETELASLLDPEDRPAAPAIAVAALADSLATVAGASTRLPARRRAAFDPWTTLADWRG